VCCCTLESSSNSVFCWLSLQLFAGDVVRAPCGVMHGKTSPVFHTDKGVLQGLEK
jgi:anthranilate/para-aminobenzoate synthase component II